MKVINQRTLWAAVAILALFAMLRSTPLAEARVPKEATGDTAEVCRKIQDWYDKDYAAVHNPETTPEDRQRLLKEMEWLGGLWNDACTEFGKISSHQIAPVKSGVDATGLAPVAGASDQPAQSPAVSRVNTNRLR